jgi:hypothetical protein
MIEFAVDYTKPNIARMYDYWLGGKSHGQADRDAADRLTEMNPGLPMVLMQNRVFLRKAVAYLIDECGIRQFLDIGTGLPTADNTHQVALQASRDCRVVYVDNDIVVVRHAQALLAGDAERTGVVHGDLRDPRAILADPETVRLLDLSRPVGVLMVSVLPFLTDDEDPHDTVRTIMGRMPADSHLVLTHPELQNGLRLLFDTYNTHVKSLIMRPRDQIQHFFDGLEMASPGLVPLPEWRPTEPADAAEYTWLVGGVGRKP